MLNASRQKAVGLDFLFSPLPVQKLYCHFSRPLNILEILRDRKTAFLINRHVLAGPDDFRVDEHHWFLRGIFLRDIQHKDTFQDADLAGRKADARGVIHCFQHVISKRTGIIIDCIDGRADLAQDRIRNGDNRAYRHATDIGNRAAPVNAEFRCSLTVFNALRQGAGWAFLPNRSMFVS